MPQLPHKVANSSDPTNPLITSILVAPLFIRVSQSFKPVLSASLLRQIKYKSLMNEVLLLFALVYSGPFRKLSITAAPVNDPLTRPSTWYERSELLPSRPRATTYRRATKSLSC